MPRPLMTAASKSALIEQLKARHSSQQHKLQELAVRVEQTRKDNRRLRNTLLLLVAAAIAIVVAVFHNRIFPHSPAPLPLPRQWVQRPARSRPPPAAAHKQPEGMDAAVAGNGGKESRSARDQTSPVPFTRKQKPGISKKTMPRWHGIRISMRWS